MTALKAHEVDRFLNRPDLAPGVFLVYGSDPGLVRERARKLITLAAGADPDPMAMTTLDAGELAADPSRLALEARTSSLFGGRRAIRVRGATKALAPTIAELLDDMPDAAVVLEADNLPPADTLRKLAEGHRQATALPCYPDTDETLGALIRQTLAESGISADPDVVPAIRETLGNDREVTRRELEKLVLFAAESKKLAREDVIALCGDNSAILIDQICDAVGTGNAARLDTSFNRALLAGIDAQRLLIVALQHFAWLRRLRAEVDLGKPARQALDGARPRPHFSRRSALEQQLRLWTDDALANAGARLNAAILESRKSARLANSIAHRALLAVSLAAAQR